ncbi:TRAP transporter TatT component family protein [Thermodesulfobacteriota bacterium]
MRRSGHLSIILLLVFSLWSCSTRKMVVNELSGIIETGMPAFEQEDDLEMLEKAFPANIKLLETFLQSDPDNYRMLVLLSRFYASYGFVFVEGELEKAILGVNDAPIADSSASATESDFLKEALNRYYLKGADYALKALETRYPDCRGQLRKIATQDQFFQKITPADVPGLFWYGFNLGLYVNLNRDSIKVLSKAHLAEKSMKRVIELRPDYYYGGAHLFLLSYYASRPPMMGGNLNLAQSHYDKVKELAGDDFLLADLFYARYYLYQKQERDAYQKVLSGIVQHQESRQLFRLYNKVAVLRAELYLSAIDQLFE